MIILELFIDFIDKIIKIEVMGIALIEYLVGFAITIAIFRVLDNFVGINRKKKKKESDKE